MNRFPIPAAFLIASVALAQQSRPSFGCTTTCGLQAPLERGNSCVQLQEFENRVLSSFTFYVAGWSQDRVCAAFAGWSVFIWSPVDHLNHAFSSPIDGQFVLGQTWQPKHLILVGTNVWGDSALAHELAHVADHALGTKDENDAHKRWTERGVCRAINIASDHFHCDYKDPSYGWLVR